MDTVDYIIDFFLTYLVCPWKEISSYSIAVMLLSIGLLILVFIMISLNKANDFKQECKKLREFMYTICILLIPCFAILLPIYLFIPSVIFSLLYINKKEKMEIKRLYSEYGLTESFEKLYKNERVQVKKELLFILVSSILIVFAMNLIGFGYSIKPILPNL
jgi:hypothetical protein